MSALEITYLPSRKPTHLHVVREGEVSANSRRRRYATAMRRTRNRTRIRVYAALSSAAAIFATMVTTMAIAFWSIPNSPLP